MFHKNWEFLFINSILNFLSNLIVFSEKRLTNNSFGFYGKLNQVKSCHVVDWTEAIDTILVNDTETINNPIF